MKTPDPTDICETILRDEIAYNIEHECLKSESAVAERMLDRRLEMMPVYAELHKKLGQDDRAMRSLFGAILSATFWNPEAIAEARAGRAQLVAVNAEIAKTADALARLLTERDKLHHHSGFHSNTEYHPAKLIDRAGETNYYFTSWVRKELKALRQFEFKYWPKISECITVLARDAEAAEIEASDDITEAATRASRKGLADYLKVIFAAIEARREGSPILIPLDFTLTDASYATLINCSLGLADEGVDAAFVKNTRKRERARAATDA